MTKYLFLAIAVFLIPAISRADMNTANQALKSGDYARAAEEFKILAEQGNAKAQSHLGYLYYVGEGVPQSYEEAVAWYGKAAVQGDRDAQYNYAVAYAFGEGIKQDYKEAAIWYRRAAEQGHAIAQYSLGISYNYGEGVPQDEKLAAEWFLKSAQAGYENAQVMVASLYHTGDGLPKDYAKAVEWYRKAADQGNAVAQYNLGSIYRAGKGVPKNNDEAMKWYRLAAAQDYEAAKTELASLERSNSATTNEKTPVPPPAPVEKEPPVAKKETVTTPVEKKSGISTSEETTTPPVARDVTKNEPVVVTTEAESAQADTGKSGDGFFGTLKNIFKSDKPEEIPQPVPETATNNAGSENIKATPAPTPEPEVDDVQVEKTSPVITEITVPESTANAPEAEPESPAPAAAPAEKTKKPVFIPGKSVTSISDLTRPRMESLEPVQSGTEISAQTTALVEPPKKEVIAETAAAPEKTIPVTTEDTVETSDGEEKTGGLAGFFGRMFSSDEKESNEPVAESVTAPANEKTPAQDAATEKEEPGLHGMEELQIAKLDVPAQTGVPLDTKAGHNIEIVTENSIDILTSQAVTGDPDAQFQLAQNYYNGNSVEQDFPRAFIWFRRAALQGNSEAQYNLGNMYLAGEGIEKSETEARNWYQLAARQEHEAARNKLDNLNQVVTDTPVSTEVDHGNETMAAATEVTQEAEVEKDADKGGLFGYIKNIFTGQEKPPAQEDSQLSAITKNAGQEASATKTEVISYSEKSAPTGQSLLASNEVKSVPDQDTSLETTTTAESTELDTDSQASVETSTDKNPESPQENADKGGVFSFFGNLFSSEEKNQEADVDTTESIVADSPTVAVNAVNNEPVISPGTDTASQASAETVQTDEIPSDENPATGQQGEKVDIALAMPEPGTNPGSTSPGSSTTTVDSVKQLEIGQIRLLAEEGDVIAQARLGYKYYAGEGVAQSYTEAMKWFRKSAVQGDSYAQYNLAVMYAFGEGTARNMEEAVIWYRRAAKQNHAVAQYSLGFCYAFGEGVPRDEKAAAEWYLKSANQGYLPAQVMAGNAYHSGTGLPKDYNKAMAWYRKAADQGDAAAQYNLGTMYLLGQGIAQSDAEARNWYEKAASQGYAAARENLDNLQRIKAEHLSQIAATDKQETGSDGATETAVNTTQYEDQAMTADTQAASSQETPGDSEKSGGVFSFFGNLFSSDKDKPDNDEGITETSVTDTPAVASNKEAEPMAKTGDSSPVTESVKDEADNRSMNEAQIAKADIPAQTKVPLETKAEKQLATQPADSIEALTAQAVAGNPDAQLQLGKDYYQGNKVERDPAQAFLWYRRSALQGNVEAQYTLGNMYLMGEGTAQNDIEARNWYEKAAQQGHEAAQHNLENLEHAVADKPSNNVGSSEKTVAATTENKRDSAYGSVDKEVKAADLPTQTAAATPPGHINPKPVTSSIPGQSDYERGLAYTYGDGVPQNYDNAFKLFESAAKLGNASAQYQLALAYSNGHGVTRNPSVAVEWYEKAARQGLTVAQRSLGNAYLNGVGVQPNKPMALAWYSLLAEQGNVLDIHRRDTLKKELTDAEVRESENLKKQLSASLSTASTTY